MVGVSETPAPLRILVADDHAGMRHVLERVFNRWNDLELVGSVESGESAVDAVRSLDPAVIVMDVEMPGIGGIEATRRIAEGFPHIRIVGYSSHEDADVPARMRSAGATDFVTKGAPLARLLEAIRRQSSS